MICFGSELRITIPEMDIAANLEVIRGRIAQACARAGRNPETVTLLAVTKGQPPEAVSAAAAAGLQLFAESKVQEAKAKIPLCSSRIRWHMIGHLQTNKCRDAVQLFDMVQSVDSLNVAEELNKRADQACKKLPILLEVNPAGEASKFGYTPARLLEELPAIVALNRLEVHGLMTVSPWSPDPEKVRPRFRELRELKQRCEDRISSPLPHLSMGMSGDFEVAIEEGATFVRIGTLLFGPRPRPKVVEE